MKCEQKTIILYISLDGGYSYRQNYLCEETFKKKLWETACKWLRPDSDMSLDRYCADIIIRYKDMTLAGVIRVAGGCYFEKIWKDIIDLWNKIQAES